MWIMKHTDELADHKPNYLLCETVESEFWHKKLDLLQYKT